MSWETLAWRPGDAETVPGTDALTDLLAIARSATDEAVSAVVMQPITTTGLSVSATTWGDLPAGFEPATSFELLGTPRRGVWVALDPALGSRLAGTDVTAIGLATAILEALDAVLVEIVGEGLSTAPADGASLDPAAELVLLRLALGGPDEAEVAIVTAVEARVPVELATHVAALQALGPSPAPARSTAPKLVEARPAVAPDHGSVARPAPAGAPSAPRDAAPATTVRPFILDELPPVPVAPTSQNIELLMGVNLQVTVEIGRTRLAIRDVLSLTPGSIVELDKLAGEKVDVLVNGQQIAQGEVVVVDENFGVRITDVVSPQRRILSADSAA
jgi:flagellar motor switch protein FliN